MSEVLDKVLGQDYGLELELVVVNDCSTDKSGEIIKKYSQKYKQLKLLTNEKNSGKSQSVKKGILATTGDLVVINDADLEYDPKDLVGFVKLFQTSDVDIVYGNRFGKSNKVIYPKYWVGNTALSLFSALFTGLRAGMWPRDMHCCYKMAKGDIYRELAAKVTSMSSFGFDTEITIRFSKHRVKGSHLRFAQLPVYYSPRSFAEGKKLRADTDGIKALWEIIEFNLLKR